MATRRIRLPEPDRGSVIPLVLGIVVLALLMVAGSVAAADAFAAQRDLQDVCDGAAAAAAGSADLGASRQSADADRSLLLAAVQQAVDRYLARDPTRSGVASKADIVSSPDGDEVRVVCLQTVPLAFGGVFGFTDGIQHRVTSTARSPILRP